MSKEEIERGDKVNIEFSNGDIYYNCEILHTPADRGDSWHIRTKEGNLVYVQCFETMILRKE